MVLVAVLEKAREKGLNLDQGEVSGCLMVMLFEFHRH